MSSMIEDESLHCDIPDTCRPTSLSSDFNDEPHSYGPNPLERSDTNENFNEFLEELKVDATRDGADDLTRRNRKKDVYKLETDWLISNVCWSNNGQHRVALTSFIEEYKNFVQVVHLASDDTDEELEIELTFEHPYPATQIQWIPKQLGNSPDLLATTADYLRLWRVDQNSGARLECLMNCNQGSKLCAPLTSFDWSSDASTIVTSSVDTTCAIWDINTAAQVGSFDANSAGTNGTLKTQLVAHEGHVYDVTWSAYGSGKNVIATSSADGSVRLFDLRNLSTSTVLYESGKTSSNRSPLVRVSCSKMESNLVATFANDSSELIILDTRNPGEPLCLLDKHLDSINSMSWSSQSARSICSGAGDKQVLIWLIPEQQEAAEQTSEPILAYRASGKINSTSWAPSNIWVAIGYRNCLELLRV